MKKTHFTFVDIKEIVRFEFIPQSQSLNQAYPMEITKRLPKAMRRKRPELWPTCWILHHHNASAHKVLLSSSFWPKNTLLK
jgi:hypothetical protein